MSLPLNKEYAIKPQGLAISSGFKIFPLNDLKIFLLLNFHLYLYYRQ